MAAPPRRRTVSRAAAGIPPPARTRSPMNDPLGITIHYSGSLADARPRHVDCAAVLLSWYRLHTEPGGLGVPEGGADIGYNWTLCPHGYRFVLRGRQWCSGANGTSASNRRHYAVCVMGGDRAGRRDVTPEALWALEDLILQLGRELDTLREVWPHRHWRSTGCPGEELVALIPRFRRLLASARA